MKTFIADSSYHQFYVADRELEPQAPEEWTEADVAANHLTLKHIAALCPRSHLDAKVTSCGPDDAGPDFVTNSAPDFEVRTAIELPSGKVGIYGWPWELEDEYTLGPGMCEILFQGFAISQIEEEADFYFVRVWKREES